MELQEELPHDVRWFFFDEAIKNSYFDLMHKGDSMKNNIDLHMHSIYSDGSYTPEELVISAR